MGIEQRPVIAISLLSEIAQAISHLTSDRALLFLTESAVSLTESIGALLLTPHEKNSTMIPFIKSFQESAPEPDIRDEFLNDCFSAYLRLRDNMQVSGVSEYEISARFSIKKMSAWPVTLSGKPVALLVMFKPAGRVEFSQEQRSFLEIITPFMGSLFENFRLNNEMIHKNSRLSALYEISQQAESLIDFRNIYDALGKVARSFINFDTYLLYFLSSDGKLLEARKENGNDDSFPRTINVGEGPVGLAAKELKPYLTYTHDYNSVLILPIEVSGRLIGVLVIGSRKPYAYRDEDIIGLQIIATQIAS
ncbi:MAG: GAF domain-containing protein, partial [Erysipelotrichia bacterium]|nr:GAF domain-containing protein [Erysipelotrichia bacterium]